MNSEPLDRFKESRDEVESDEQQDTIRSVQPAEGFSDKEMLDWIQRHHYTILACHMPRTFMITLMGKPSGTHDNVRQAITDAIKKEREG